MRKLVINSTVLLLLSMAAFSQLQTLEVKEIKPDSAIPIFTDYPDNAAIIIYTSLTNLSISSNMGIVSEKSDPGDGKYILIVRPTRQALRIQCSGFMESSYRTPTLNPKQLLYLSVEQATGPEIPVVILTEPSDANVVVDGVNLGVKPHYKIKTGVHDITIQKIGYKTVGERVEISDKSNVFSYTLQEIMLVMVTLKTNPSGASIYIDDVSEGLTNKQIFKFPGEYNLKLILNKYEIIDQTINVAESGNNTWSFDLVKTTAMLTINTVPPDAEIWINGELKHLKTVDLAPSQYRIVVNKDGWYSDSRTITVKKGQKLTQSFTLQQITGNLQVEVDPMETEVNLMQGTQVITWSGSKYLGNLPVGQHTMRFTAEGYISQNRTVTIDTSLRTTLKITLKKRSTVQQSRNDGDMIFVEGGTFLMGDIWGGGFADEKPNYLVTLSDFYISKYELTQKQYKEIVGNNPSDQSADNHPVENVTWYDAIEFCNKLSVREGLEPCYMINGDSVSCDWNANGYRLPSEAEWEYAARGGGREDYKWSGTNNDGGDLDNYAWYNSNSAQKTHPVGTKAPNSLNIYDMTGNVAEWCWDWYGHYPTSSYINPTGSWSGSTRVFRGGSWRYNVLNCRTTNRFNYIPTSQEEHIGFRVCKKAE